MTHSQETAPDSHYALLVAIGSLVAAVGSLFCNFSILLMMRSPHSPPPFFFVVGGLLILIGVGVAIYAMVKQCSSPPAR